MTIKSTSKKIFDVNLIEPGDGIYVENGRVHVVRRKDSRFANFDAPLYPWKTASILDSKRVAIPKTATAEKEGKALVTGGDDLEGEALAPVLAVPVGWKDKYLNLTPEAGHETAPFYFEGDYIYFAESWGGDDEIKVILDKSDMQKVQAEVDAFNSYWRKNKNQSN